MSNNDVLVTFASWEDRFRVGFDRDLEKVEAKTALVFYFGSYEERTRSNRQAINEECKKKRIRYIPSRTRNRQTC